MLDSAVRIFLDMLHTDDADISKLQSVVDKLVSTARADSVFLIDKAGELVVAGGDLDSIDSTSLASLTASGDASAQAIAKELNEGNFVAQMGEGADHNVHLQRVGKLLLLVIVYGQQAGLGLVRLRARKAAVELEELVSTMVGRLKGGGNLAADDISDADLDALFGD